MRSSDRRPWSAARFLPLFAVVVMLIPAYGFAAPSGPGPADATRQLFAAVQANDFQAVQTSIGAGADVEARNSWGFTAADVAVDRGYFRIAHYLVSIRNFQRPKTEPTAATAAASNPAVAATAAATAKAALTQAKPPTGAPAAAKVPAASPRAAAPPVSTPADSPAVTADRSPPVLPAAAGGAGPFDPSRPAYGATLPAAADSGS